MSFFRICCIICCSWINPIFSIGHKRNLELEDIYNVLPEDSSEHLSNKLEKLEEFTI